MITTLFVAKRYLLLSAAAITLSLSGVAHTQDNVEASKPDSVAQEETKSAHIFTPDDFKRFAPRNALDMLMQVPGFTVRDSNQARGLGQTSMNVLVNGQRLSSKSQNIFDQLQRITANNVERIEVVDGATLKIPGLSGQTANVITKGGKISGRFEYRNMFRPKYAKPGYIAGEVSVTGSTPKFEWTTALTNNASRGAAGGPGYAADGLNNVTEWRDIYMHFEGEFPRISGSLKWLGPDSMVANINANYSRIYTDFTYEEDRDLVSGIDQFRDFKNRERGYGYEIGGDFSFRLGPGQMKLIGIERFNNNDMRQNSVLILEDESSPTGSRFGMQSDSGERIGRTEYQWDMLGGNWQLDTEAAFNRLDQASQLYNLDSFGDLVEIPFPSGTGGVTEDRYEMILTHKRTLYKKFTMQLGAGGEYSKLAQTGSNGLTRTFFRPKGSLTLARSSEKGLDLSFKLARSVGQLSFGDFLAQVFLQEGNANAGNAELKPSQSWDADLEIKKNLGKWGSTNLRLFARWYEDYIDIIPLEEGGESPGNIDSAELYGIDWNSTVNLDPIGWKGAKLDFKLQLEESSIRDPLTGESRPFSNHYNRRLEIPIRHDIPGSNWAWGMGMQYNHVKPFFRLSEIVRDYEGPIYTWAFIEHKDVYGLTVNLQVFNLTNGRGLYHRTVYAGLRDRSKVLFIEDRDLSVQPIFRLKVTGSF
jgi:hypothetical protein